MTSEDAQITRGLPLEKIKKIIINENNESLIEIRESENLILLREHKYLYPYLRQSALKLLIIASNNLPKNYKLLVVTAFRPIWMQKKLWKRRLWQMAKAYPIKMIFNHGEWIKLVSRYTSPPGGSSHQCGAAVDVTLVDDIGERLDMGTALTDFGEKVHTHSYTITEKQKENRQVLYEAMTKAGFANYPLEWWHYSYGDRMWAAYTRHVECFYGPLKDK